MVVCSLVHSLHWRAGLLQFCTHQQMALLNKSAGGKAAGRGMQFRQPLCLSLKGGWRRGKFQGETPQVRKKASSFWSTIPLKLLV